LLALSLLGAAGCQDAEMSDDTLPPPNFNHQPVAYQQPTVIEAPPPVVQQQPPVQQAPRQQIVQAPPPVQQLRSTEKPMVRVPVAWIPPRSVKINNWQWIIIHHTATSFGNAAIVTQWHIDRGFDEMGYHFLIGNGTNSGDGQVEVGTRWPKQKWGAHTKSPDNRFNDFGIGICLVGNFDETRPTAAQVRSLETLVAYLMRTYHISPDHVLGHNDCKSTDCPGKNLNVGIIRRNVVQMLAAQGVNFAEPRLAAGTELIH